jgi:5-methylcytosine-specific restriction endonuclease McrA
MITKRCTKCGAEKPRDSAFVRDSTRPDGFYSICKDCRGSYYQRNRHWIVPQYREYREAHKDKIREQHRAYAHKRFFFIKANNLRRRNGKVRPAPIDVLATCIGIAQLWKKQRGICPLTGRRLNRESAQLDHIVPLRRGGSDALANLRWVHRDANYAKRDLLDEEFFSLCSDVVNRLNQ